MKDLYPKMFVVAVDKEARISDIIDFAPDGGGRSWNLLLHREFQDWETTIFYDFFVHISSKLPKGVMRP